jgi:hypothetical protein
VRSARREGRGGARSRRLGDTPRRDHRRAGPSFPSHDTAPASGVLLLRTNPRYTTGVRAVLVLFLLASVAEAQVVPPRGNLEATAVPPGRRWYCVVAAGQSACFRSTHQCAVLRQELADQGLATRVLVRDASFCMTFQNEDGESAARCAHSAPACNTLRAARFAANRAAAAGLGGDQSRTSNISRCERVGVTSPPDPAPGEEAESPSRDVVLTALRSVDGAVRACRGAPRPVINPVVHFGSNGRVREVDLSDLGDGASVAYRRCVDAAVRDAVVPRFRRESFSVQYPFSTVRY